MNTLHGSGMVFLQAGGTVMRCDANVDVDVGHIASD